MEALINIISHDLVGGLAVGLLFGSVLNWYSIKHFTIKLVKSDVARLCDSYELELIKEYKNDGMLCKFCDRFNPLVWVQIEGRHPVCHGLTSKDHKDKGFSRMLPFDGQTYPDVYKVYK